MKRNVSKYSTPQAKAQSAKRVASKRRSNPGLGPAAIVSDMDDIANYTVHQQVIDSQMEQFDDVLFA